MVQRTAVKTIRQCKHGLMLMISGDSVDVMNQFQRRAAEGSFRSALGARGETSDIRLSSWTKAQQQDKPTVIPAFFVRCSCRCQLMARNMQLFLGTLRSSKRL